MKTNEEYRRLEQQLAEREKQIVMMRGAVKLQQNVHDERLLMTSQEVAVVQEALAATQDLSGLVLCDAEHVGNFYQNEETGHIGNVDRWQVENGFFVTNPKLVNLGKLYKARKQQ